MAKQAPNPVDVQDFQFKLHCRLKVFANEDIAPFNKPCNLLATASRYGLIFVGTASPVFQVILLSTVENYTLKDGGEIPDYSRRIVFVPSPPKHLAVNCDCTRLAVVVERQNCPVALIYDVTSMLRQEISTPIEIILSPTPGMQITETSWNPSVPDMFTACKSDGTLGLYELKSTGVDIKELPAEARATCMCWSPKGKQIAVGSFDGKITQYRPDLKAMKVVNAPPMAGSPSVAALQWISNYQFIAVYKPQMDESSANLLVVDAPKVGETVFTNYDDICYSYGNMRPVQYYAVFQSNWNILMLASSNSMEVGVLGSEADRWTQWILADSARAELPLSTSKQETMPIGLAFDSAAVEPILWGETTLPPAPFLFVLSHHGLLCCFRIINIKAGVASICHAPEPLHDKSGLSQFTNTVAPGVIVGKLPELPKQPILSTPPPQVLEAEAPQQPPMSFAQPLPLTTPKVQFPLFTTPPAGFTSQFQSPKPPDAVPAPKMELPAPKPAPQSLFGVPIQQPVAKVAPPPPVLLPITPVDSPILSPMLPPQSAETNVGQEEADALIAKLIREECDMLDAELRALLHKGRELKVDFGSDAEAVELVRGADGLDDFLNEVAETSSTQDAEVHLLKQELIQTWAWYEDARSRLAQTQDTKLETLMRVQQMDPVSQRYQSNIQHMTYYLESQLAQARRALDEQWETFQDASKKTVRMKLPTMEAIYQTMVRQNAVLQKQTYVLKDVSSRIRAHRSKITRPSLLVSLNSADQLEQELRRLQLEPQNVLHAQHERVLQNQRRLTAEKVRKLSRLLSDKNAVNMTLSRPKLSQSMLQGSPALRKNLTDPSLLGVGLSPIAVGKHVEPRVVDFVQSTPKPSGTLLMEPKQVSVFPLKPAVAQTSMSFKFTSNAPIATPPPSLFSQLPPTVTTTTGPKTETNVTTTLTPQIKFVVLPSTSVFSMSTTSSMSTVSSSMQPSFSLSTTKVSSAPALFTIVPISQAKSSGETTTTKPSASFGSLFGATTKSFSVTTTVAAITTKSLVSTSTSAFVPTTQVAFNFSLKSNTDTGASVTSTISKLPTFVFGTSNQAVTTNSVVITTSATVPSTAAVTVVSSAPTPIFSALKTSSVDSVATSIVCPISSKTSAEKINSVFQGFTLPKATTAVTETTPSIEKTTPSSPIPLQAVTTASVSSSLFSFVKPDLTPQSTAISAAVTITKVNTEKQPILKIPSPSGNSIFSAAASGTTTASIFGTAASASSNLATITPTTAPLFAAAAAATLFSTAASPTSSIFASPGTATLGSLFSNATPTSSSAAFFGTPLAQAASPFGTAVPQEPDTAPVAALPLVASSAASVAPLNLSTPTATLPSVFGSVAATTSSGSIFGSIAAVPATTPSSSLPSVFGSVATTSSGSIFGSIAAVPATTTSSSIFGSVATTPGSLFSAPPATTTASLFAAVPVTATSIFGPPAFVTAAVTTTTQSIFAPQPTTTASSVFGGPPFAAAPKSTATTPFGAAFASSTTDPPFGSTTTTSGSLFGQPAAFGGGSIFGASPPNSFNNESTGTSTFGSGSSVFGGGSSTTTSNFAQPFSFATAAANVSSTSSAFGFAKPTTFGFGATAAAPSPPADSSSFSFGGLNMGSGTTAAPSPAFGSGFGQTPNPNPFAKIGADQQQQKPAFGSPGLLGAPATTTPSSIFGGGTSPTGFGSSFGSPGFGSGGFAQQPAFSQSTFGTGVFGSSTQPGPFSGGNQSVAQTGFGGFGQAQKSTGFSTGSIFGGASAGFGAPPAFGAGSSAFGGAPAFSSPPKVFGGTGATTAFGAPPQQENPTFANLATQNTLGFGSLAQQTPSNSPMSSFSGGSSSFSTWR